MLRFFWFQDTVYKEFDGYLDTAKKQLEDFVAKEGVSKSEIVQIEFSIDLKTILLICDFTRSRDTTYRHWIERRKQDIEWDFTHGNLKGE